MIHIAKAPCLQLVLVLVGSLVACSSKPPVPDGPSLTSRREAAAAAVTALRATRFVEARSRATNVLARDAGNSAAAAVRALTIYVATMHQLRVQTMAVLRTSGAGFDHPRMRKVLEDTLTGLGAVDADLAVAAADGNFELELCLACWERDWNHSGAIDDNDRLFLQLEIDGQGKRLKQGDPRRKPTFRFDVGDVLWARAMVSFQRATLELLLAYRWTELDKLMSLFIGGEMPVIRIRLEDAKRVHRARELILAGVGHAQMCREAYLAEDDDDREWVPNPKQRNHPLPLPVNAALYETWKGVLGDVRALVAGDTGISAEEVAQLGDHRWQKPPRGFVNIASMLEQPADIVIDLKAMDRRAERELDIDGLLRDLLGPHYRDSMKPSSLVRRLGRMKNEMDRGEDTMERKLRYLLWLN